MGVLATMTMTGRSFCLSYLADLSRNGLLCLCRFSIGGGVFRIRIREEAVLGIRLAIAERKGFGVNLAAEIAL